MSVSARTAHQHVCIRRALDNSHPFLPALNLYWVLSSRTLSPLPERELWGQGLISPKTLLAGCTVHAWNASIREVKAEDQDFKTSLNDVMTVRLA